MAEPGAWTAASLNSAGMIAGEPERGRIGGDASNKDVGDTVDQSLDVVMRIISGDAVGEQDIGKGRIIAEGLNSPSNISWSWAMEAGLALLTSI